jgi:hypothetical protein
VTKGEDHVVTDDKPVTGARNKGPDKDGGVLPEESVGPADAAKAEAKKPARKKSESDSTEERGEMSPVQFDDDGWGDLPVQMRG